MLVAGKGSSDGKERHEDRIGLPAAVPGTEPTMLGRWAAAGEDLGFQSLGVIDRLVYDNLEPLTALAAAAARSRRAELLTLVLNVCWRQNAVLLATMRRVWAGAVQGASGPMPALPDRRPGVLIGGLVEAACTRAGAGGGRRAPRRRRLRAAVTIPYRCPASIAGAGPDRTEDQTVKLHARTRTLLAWALWLVTFACCAAGLLVTLALVRPLTLAILAQGAAFALAFPLGFATVGLLLTLRRPANPIGWLYAGAGLAWSWDLPFGPWIDRLVRDHRPLPLVAQVVSVVADFGWAPAIALGVTLPALLLPDGRLRSRRWRLVVATAVAGATLAMVAGTLAPGPLESQPGGNQLDYQLQNPFALPGAAGAAAGAVAVLGILLHWFSLPAAATCVVLRFRSSRGVERQQLRWVVAGAAVAVILLVPKPGGEQLPGFVTEVAVLAVPVSVAVAVLRYRLWDLDRLVSRTVTYAVVTALLVVPYLLILPVATRLAGGSGSLAVAAVTLAAAALFQPLRRRVQQLVDRRFNRRRYDAARTVESFATRLRDQLDLDALHGELLGVVDQTVAPTTASLWLRPSANPRRPI